MNTSRAWLHNTVMNVKLAFRDRQAIFWNFVLPLFFLFAFSSLFAREKPEMVGSLLPGLLCLSIMSAGFFGMSIVLVNMRERGILRRYRLAPINSWLVITSQMAASLVIACFSPVLQLTLAKLIYHVKIVGNIGTLMIVLLIGLAVFHSFGFIIAGMAENVKTAQVLSNMLFLPMMFFGGAVLPLQHLPPKLQQVTRMLPSSYLVDALNRVMNDGWGLAAIAKNLGVMLLGLIVALFISTILFRWDNRESLPLKQKVWAAAIIVFFIGAAFVVKF